MHTIWRFASTLGFLLIVSASASAQPLEYPRWREGQHVYVIPEGWQPPVFGANDLSRMEGELRTLHFPFYVVISSRLYGPDTEENAALAIDSLAERWAETASGYDASTSQIFLLTYDGDRPNLYRFLAGSKFKTELGFAEEAHRPYLDRFVAAMRGTPRDPRGGIMALATSADAYLVDATDPVKIAQRAEATRQAANARAEAERVAAAQARLDTARANLDALIQRLTELLGSPKEILPADTSSYHDLLAMAQQVRAEQDDPKKITSFGDSIAWRVQKLADTTAVRQEAISAAQRKTVLIYGSIGLGMLGLFFFFIMRIIRRDKLQVNFAKEIARMEEMVTNASSRYVGFNDKRDAVKALGEQHGRTKELFDTVSIEVDDIFSSVCAVKSHMGRCKLEAAKAGFWNFGPLVSAQAKLTGTFTFDTGEMDEGTLFGSETKTITVDVAKFTGDLETRYKACIDGWNRLKAATEQVGKTARELFPHANLDALMAMADTNGIPRRWLHDHPLYGDDAADEAMYADLDASNQSDPVAFSEGVTALNAKEVEMTERLHHLMDILKGVTTLRDGTTPSTYGAAVDPGDDPAPTFESARREDARFMALLASSETVQEVEQQAQKAMALYREVHVQNQAIKLAVDTVEADLDALRTGRTLAEQEQMATLQRLRDAQRVHSNLTASRSLTQGQTSLKEAQTMMSSATMAHAARRLLAASKAAKDATASAKAARQSFAEVMAACDAADAKRTSYLSAVDGMTTKRDNAAAAIIGYNCSANLATFTVPRVSGPADYDALMASLVTVRESWTLAERKAREAYEAEQRRRREAEERARRAREAEAQRQRDAAAAARRAAAAAASRRSSGGGGLGGGGRSSSSGGRVGGGRSSSSGGRL
jgi:uncharacterized membrane protein YgcG